MNQRAIDASCLEAIVRLPMDWHPLGGFDEKTARAIVRICADLKIKNSAETGAGKSTLLFSHLSEKHTVFSLDEGRSLSMVLESPYLRQNVIEVCEGPSQVTLPSYTFADKLQLALIDGPHAYPFPDLEYYYFYPHLDKGALLIVDDIDIATIHNLYRFLRQDAMFELIEVVEKTAFFRRTDSPLFDPLTGWWREQGYNTRKKTLDHSLRAYASRTAQQIRQRAPASVRRQIKRALKSLNWV